MIRTLLLSLAVLAVVAFGVPLLASTAFTRSATPQSLTASSEVDCEMIGGDLNALLKAKHNSPNIARATSEFERGVAECMWGRFDAASQHYEQVYTLLRG